MKRKQAIQLGTAIASVLMVVAMAVVLVFSLAGTSIFHLNMTTNALNRLNALNLADSAISQCIERIVADVYYGESQDKTIEIQGNTSDSKNAGYVTFSPVDASRFGIPLSKNNYRNDASTQGWNNRIVPMNSIHIIGTGVSNGVTRHVEAIVHVPPFPYSIAANGKFSSSGKLLVASALKPQDVTGGPIDPGKLLPGNLVANSTDPKAVKISGEGTITGDLKTAGDIELNKDSNSKIEVLGEISRYCTPVKIPRFDISKYDPEQNADYKCGLQTLPSYLSNPSLEGFCRVNGNLDVSGDLNLNGALIYVDGNINISGGLKGKGALVCSGKTNVAKGSSLASDNLVALLSKGDVKLGGSGNMDSSSFQGIIYTEGNFKADQITLCGAFISGGTGTSADVSSNTTMEVSNAKLINVSDYAAVNTYIEPSVTIDLCGNTTDFDGKPIKAMSIDNLKHQPYNDPADITAKMILTKKHDGNRVYYRTTSWGGGDSMLVRDYPDLASIARQLDTYIRASSKYKGMPCNNENDHGYGIEPGTDFAANMQNSIDSVDNKTKVKNGQWVNFRIDPNEFLSNEDKMKIILWREI